MKKRIMWDTVSDAEIVGGRGTKSLAKRLGCTRQAISLERCRRRGLKRGEPVRKRRDFVTYLADLGGGLVKVGQSADPPTRMRSVRALRAIWYSAAFESRMCAELSAAGFLLMKGRELFQGSWDAAVAMFNQLAEQQGMGSPFPRREWSRAAAA